MTFLSEGTLPVYYYKNSILYKLEALEYKAYIFYLSLYRSLPFYISLLAETGLRSPFT